MPRSPSSCAAHWVFPSTTPGTGAVSSCADLYSITGLWLVRAWGQAGPGRWPCRGKPWAVLRRKKQIFLKCSDENCLSVLPLFSSFAYACFQTNSHEIPISKEHQSSAVRLWLSMCRAAPVGRWWLGLVLPTKFYLLFAFWNT